MKRKIALLSQPIDGVRPPRQNSIGISVYEFARRLASRHDVAVITQDRPGTDQPAQEAGVRYHYLPVGRDHWLHRQYERLGRLFGAGAIDFRSRLFFLLYAFRAALIVRRGNFDIVHLINHYQFVPIIRALNPRCRIVLNMRCEWLTQIDRGTIAKRLQQLDRVIGCSEHITGRVRDRFPELAAKCRTVYNGVDIDQFRPRDGDRARDDERVSVLFVGRVSPEKGVHVLIDALPELCARAPHLRIEIVGGHQQLPLDMLVGLSDESFIADLSRFYPDDDPLAYYRLLKEEVAAAGLDACVTFTGAVPYLEIVKRFLEADILVNPSLSDAFPRAPMEAMACGIPVVATRIGGVVESVVDGETGYLVPPDDTAALTAALLRLLTDENLRRTMGRAARQRIETHLAWSSVTRALEETYLEMLTTP